MQQPTAKGIRIRSTDDAHILFHAVAEGKLQMITRRLDPQERQELRPGNCYIWEERGADAEATGMGIERWTDGKHWGPSRVRDDFLFYHQRDAGSGDVDDVVSTPDGAPSSKGRMKYGKRRRSQPPPGRSGPTVSSSAARTIVPNHAVPSSDADRLIKQTYSVLTRRPTDSENKAPRKWHLTAYFTQNMVRTLKNVSEIPELACIKPPVGLYNTARVGKKREPLDSIPSSSHRASVPDFNPNSPRSLNTLEPSSQIYHSPPFPSRSTDSRQHLPVASWPAPAPPSHLPTLATIIPRDGPSSAYQPFHQTSGPQSPDIVSPHSAGPSREYFVSSPPPSTSPASSNRSAPFPPATPPYETQELPPLSHLDGSGALLPTPTTSAFPDFRGLPPLELTPSVRLQARAVEDERALWALTNNFNR